MRNKNYLKFKNSKKIFLLILFLISISFDIVGQNTEAILIFKDGTKVIGLGKLKRGDIIKFRKNKNEKAVKYHFKDLEKVTIIENSRNVNYVYLKVKGSNKFEVLEESIIGKLSLYRVVTQGQHAPMGVGFGINGGMGMGIGMGGSFTIESFYLKRKNEEDVTHLGSTSLFSKNFKKAASNYFSDCPKLKEKIENKEYKKIDIVAIVEFYNSYCVKN